MNRRATAALAIVLFLAVGASAQDSPAPVANAPTGDGATIGDPGPAWLDEAGSKVGGSLRTVLVFGAASLAPAAVLMTTAFVRISVVLALLRQALGNPQVPGNQVMMALALMLTALVMRPQAESAYDGAVQPLLEGRISPAEAWAAGSRPIKDFMVDQIYRSGHEDYLVQLQEYDGSGSETETTSPGQASERPVYGEDLPFRVVAPAFLISELTTSLVIGFAIYLPFLVIDLVVSSVLAAMGLVMLPPSLVAPPMKLIVFVMAGGWWLVADMLLRSFGMQATGSV